MEQEPLMATSLAAPATLSIDKDDPRFRADWPDYGSRLVIELDGALQNSVLTYDTVEGFVVRLVQQDDRYVLDGDEIATETVRGIVTARLRA
jgi:hypothetical protein